MQQNIIAKTQTRIQNASYLDVLVDIEKEQELFLKDVKEILVKKKNPLADIINYYRTYYPQNPFMTDQQAVDICNKYGLIMGSPNDFMDVIPDENIGHIKSFNLRDEDILCLVLHNGRHRIIRKKELSDFDGATVLDYDAGKIRVIAPPDKFKEVGKEELKQFVRESRINPNIINPFEVFFSYLDPIILKTVAYGNLIITAYGGETSIEGVIAPESN